NWRTVSATCASHSTGSATSARKARAEPPALAIAEAVVSARAPSRSAQMSDAPSTANRFEIAVPNPPPAPVTSATFPFSLIGYSPRPKPPARKPRQQYHALTVVARIAETRSRIVVLASPGPRLKSPGTLTSMLEQQHCHYDAIECSRGRPPKPYRDGRRARRTGPDRLTDAWRCTCFG